MQRVSNLKNVSAASFTVGVVLCYVTLTVRNHLHFSVALGTAVIVCVGYLAQIVVRSQAEQRRTNTSGNHRGSSVEVWFAGFGFAAAAAMTVADFTGMWGSTGVPRGVVYVPLVGVALANSLCIASLLGSSRQQHRPSTS